MPTAADLSNVVLRLKAPAFVEAVAGFPPDQRPLVRPWVGPLLMAYALDDGDAFRFINPQMASESGLSPDALNALALRNLPAAARSAGLDIVAEGDLFRVAVRNDLGAACLLDDTLWDEMREGRDGRGLFAAPIAICSVSGHPARP